MSSAQWRKPGAEFGGTEKFFADQDDVFPGKMSIFAADLFFSHRPSFSNFVSLFRFSGSLLCYMSYMTLSSQENTFFYSFHNFAHKKNTFFHSFHNSRTSDNTTSQNIGGRMHGPSPHLKLWGDRPPVPPRFPPLLPS